MGSNLNVTPARTALVADWSRCPEKGYGGVFVRSTVGVVRVGAGPLDNV
ncbi:uncharacterized protein METZ01_LOCUS122049 [marine metagenome]|uniref:Uncharacterized protein n=1 Tax=marine metagenome TaxID=408172 RepID=A0A381XWW4_9ZZZZ